MKSTHFIAVTAALGALAACAQLLGMQDFEQAQRIDASAPDVEAPLSPTFGGFNINQPLQACGAIAFPPATATSHTAPFQTGRYYVTALSADLDGLNVDGVDTVSEKTSKCLTGGTFVVDGEGGVDNAFAARPLASELIRALFAPIESGQFGFLFEMSQMQPQGENSTQTVVQMFGVRPSDAGIDSGGDGGGSEVQWYQNPRSAPVLSGWVNKGSFAFTTAPQVDYIDLQLPGSLQPPYYLQLRLRHPVIVGCFTGPLRERDGGTSASRDEVQYDEMGRPKHIEILIAGSVWTQDFTRMGNQIEYLPGTPVCALEQAFKNSVAGQFCEGRDLRIAASPDGSKPECDGMSVGFRIRARLIERNPAPDPDVDGGTWTMDPNRCAPGTELSCAN